MKFIDRFVETMFGHLEASGLVWARLGLIVLVVAAAMSFDFGFDVSFKHAAFLAVLSLVAAFGPEAAHRMWTEGKRNASVAIAIVCAPLLLIEFYSHAGYTAGLRGSNIETASVQNAKYDGAQESVKEDKGALVRWQEQLASLEKANAWAATTTATALRAELDTMEGDFLFKRSKKCADVTKPDSRTFCDKRLAIQERIAKLEEKSKLQSQIDATKRKLDEARSAAATVEHKSSAVVHQNQFLAKAVALVAYRSLTPTAEMVEASQQSASIAMAGVATGLPAFCFFVAGLFRRGRSSSFMREVSGTRHGDTLNVAVSDDRALAELKARLREMARALPSGQVAA